MSIHVGLFRTSAACVAAAFIVLGAAGCGDDSPPDNADAKPTASPETPAPTPVPVTTVITTTIVTVTPSVSPSTTPIKPTTTTAPIAKPTRPSGLTFTVLPGKRGGNVYPEYVRTDTDPKNDGRDNLPAFICQSYPTVKVPLALNATTLTDKTPTRVGTNRVSTLQTKAGLLVFAENGSVLPSDTIIAGEPHGVWRFGTVPADLRDPMKKNHGYSMLLPKRSWGTIKNLGICRPKLPEEQDGQ